MLPRFRKGNTAQSVLRYTKYICEKVPLSEPKFSQDLLLPNYAVLPKGRRHAELFSFFHFLCFFIIMSPNNMQSTHSHLDKCGGSAYNTE